MLGTVTRMEDPFQGILARAMSLSREDRAKLVALLIENLSEERPDWALELKQRFLDFEAGKLELIPWEEVQERMRRIGRETSGGREDLARVEDVAGVPGALEVELEGA
jgi:putative addiction module component (TIGR02574 family)